MSHNSKPLAIESFKTDTVPSIVIKNSIPALIAMMMVMVYNLADTFFLGLTHNDLQVTAVSFATPLFMIFMSLGTLFGVGGTSVISRALGEKNTAYAKKTCSFCMWACVAVGAVAMILLWVFLDDVTIMLGASEESVDLTKDYLRIAIGCGVQPFLGYCYGAKKKQRLVEGIRFSAMFGLIFCAVIAFLCFIFAEPIVKVFLTDLTALDSGVHFTRILMSTAWLIGAFAIFQNTLQAVGAATPALLASLFRQGFIFIPAVFIMKTIMGVDGLIWAQPVADVLSLLVVIFMLWRKIQTSDFSDPGKEPENV